MIDTNALYRPGLAAIAAVMALSSTPVIAQVALPADPAPPTAPAAPAAVAPTPSPAAPVQTVQSVPATPNLPDLPVAETRSAPRADAPSQARSQPNRIAPRPAEVVRTAENARPAPANPRQIAPATPAAAPAPEARSDMTPVQTRAPEAVPPVAETPPANAQTAVDGNNAAGWVLLGGGLLLVAGGAAFALSRRPRRQAQERAFTPAQEDALVVAPTPAAATAVAVEPLMPRPVARQPVHDPVPPRKMAPVERRMGDVADHRTTLEAMVAEAPSEANPFRSRRNRLRRANFLIRTGQAEPRQGEYRVTEDREAAPVGATGDRWSEMRFQGRQKTSISWKPARN